MTELLLIADKEVDENLQAVMRYRLNKNPALLVIDLKDYVEVINHAQTCGLPCTFPSIEKLGILHHSGNAVLKQALYDYVPTIRVIGDSLPKVSTVVLRGCGMVDEKRAKDLALKAAMSRDDRLVSNELAKKSLKKGMLFFKDSDLTHEHGRRMRELTLDVEREEGKKAASHLTLSLVEQLKISRLGKDLQASETPTVKCYVAGYQGDPIKGAQADTGNHGVEDRYVTAPKALRFKI